MIKKIIKITLISSVSLSCINAIEIKNNEEAINIAGKQRMFTQKIMKDYSMIGMKNTFGNPTEDMKKTKMAFEDAISSLKGYNKDAEIDKKIATVDEEWKKINSLLTDDPKKENAIKLNNSLNNLLKVSDDLTKAFEGDKAGSEIINISGRQRMLSQKMASIYMLKVWNVGDESINKSLDDTMALFAESSKTLKEAKETTPEIKKILVKVDKLFLYLKMMNKRDTQKFIPSLIYKKSNDMLKKMNDATILYVKGGK